jgi:uncharacterized protein (TIGR02145 family)
MKKQISVCMLLAGIAGLLLVINTAAIAHEKVVVIPLNSSSAKIPNNTSPCNASTAGTIRWTGADFEGCDGSSWGRLGLTANVPTVFSSGNEWMDRNLGASRVATSEADTAAYGDLYQWGRFRDGHEKRDSDTTVVTSTTDNPDHANFILVSSYPDDWRNPQNNSLWQGVTGINNPCPSGFRLPTATEWEAERDSWVSSTSAGAYGSPLKLVPAGYRSHGSGTISGAGNHGRYWSGTIGDSNSRYLYFSISNAAMYNNLRAYGHSVRCLKD